MSFLGCWQTASLFNWSTYWEDARHVNALRREVVYDMLPEEGFVQWHMGHDKIGRPEAERLWDEALLPNIAIPSEKSKNGVWTCGVPQGTKYIAAESLEAHQVSAMGYPEKKNLSKDNIDTNNAHLKQGNGFTHEVFKGSVMTGVLATMGTGSFHQAPAPTNATSESKAGEMLSDVYGQLPEEKQEFDPSVALGEASTAATMAVTDMATDLNAVIKKADVFVHSKLSAMPASTTTVALTERLRVSTYVLGDVVKPQAERTTIKEEDELTGMDAQITQMASQAGFDGMRRMVTLRLLMCRIGKLSSSITTGDALKEWWTQFGACKDHVRTLTAAMDLALKSCGSSFQAVERQHKKNESKAQREQDTLNKMLADTRAPELQGHSKNTSTPRRVLSSRQTSPASANLSLDSLPRICWNRRAKCAKANLSGMVFHTALMRRRACSQSSRTQP